MYNEKELVAQLKDSLKREAAFTILVRDFQERLYWQIRRTINTHEDTDDILQNVFLKAWQGLDSFRGEAQLSTWLYRITANETLNFLQSRKQSTGLDKTFQIESDAYIDGDRTQEQLQIAVESLPAKQRRVFTMKYYQGMKYENMSEILGTSVGALKASYHHAVSKITTLLKKEEI